MWRRSVTSTMLRMTSPTSPVAGSIAGTASQSNHVSSPLASRVETSIPVTGCLVLRAIELGYLETSRSTPFSSYSWPAGCRMPLAISSPANGWRRSAARLA